MKKISSGKLKIDQEFYSFINEEVIPGTNLDIKEFWENFENAVESLAPRNKKLIEKREIIQKEIDNWHKTNKDFNSKKDEYLIFLKKIGYIVEEKEDFKISTKNVDEEISSIAGPQLVVPVDNARYALNAANARWGSLYDAVYGTDVIKGEKKIEYDPERGKKVIDYTRAFLDSSIPIDGEQWKNVTKIELEKKILYLKLVKKNFT